MVSISIYVRDLGDHERALKILDEHAVDSMRARLFRAEIDRLKGDPTARISQIDSWIENRAEVHVPSRHISGGLYLVGDYDRYLEWFAIRVEERSFLSWFNDDLNYRWPDYWDNLREWSLSDPARIRDRTAMIDEHRALVDQVREKMVLLELTREMFEQGRSESSCVGV